LLQWLYEERLHGTTAPNISGFPNSKYGSFYGKKFTDHEIKQASLTLRERQLIRGKAGMGGPIIRPEISDRGIQIIEAQDSAAAQASEIEDLVDVSDKGETGPAGRVFIVHGHDEARKYQLARFLRDLTGHEPVILHEQPNRGSVLIEKLESSAAKTGFAVVLLTGDDFGRAKATTGERPRGRQNVVFELGFFIGALGRSKVAVLMEPGVEEPGDVTGIVYTPLDAAGAWKSALATEIDAAGITIDWSALRR
ncbi:nucleotide-binding protein, partial [Paenarthrobacter sp. CM16]|uniref:TIR domain-containing protein n=1 Tax=Paenarthrobacter sp. CM16 TaxID=2738447 RepID=UPI0015547258